jgi:hypothetical protein
VLPAERQDVWLVDGDGQAPQVSDYELTRYGRVRSLLVGDKAVL